MIPVKKERTLSSFLSYLPAYSGNRNTISLHFELLNEKQIIVHRYYYNFEEIQMFFEDKLENNRKIDIRESDSIINMNEFNTLANKFIKELEKEETLPERFFVRFRNIKDALIEEKNESIKHKKINELNDLLFGYQYITTKKRHLINEKIQKTVNKIIENNSIGNVKGDTVIKPDLIQRYQDNKLMQFRIYKAGQANCSALIKFKNDAKKEYDVVAVFDFGFQKSAIKNKDLSEMISKINDETTIIISHFDYDHINNITAFDRSKTCRWLFPEHSPKTKRGNMLYSALLKIASTKSLYGQIYSYSAPYNLSSFLQIHQNTFGKKDAYQSTASNAECIISTLTLGDRTILIPADALYRDFPTSVFSKIYTDIIIPHHCCIYPDKSVIDSGNPIECLSRNCHMAYIFSGSNKYGHANINHANWYKNIKVFDCTKFYDSTKLLLGYPANIIKIKNNYISID